ncbi:MAG: hypothetical protein GY742_22745, partial [Hyphomicrobiales bacterium]|nr:hypothetical protein [Hyphomicrobiales bacterium]
MAVPSKTGYVELDHYESWDFDPNVGPEVNASLVVDQSIDEDQPGWSYTIDDDTFFDVDNDVLTFEAALADGDPLP